MKQPPFDRTLALAASLQCLSNTWIDVRCTCGRISIIPLRLIVRQYPQSSARTLADFVLRLTCQQCSGPPARLALVENARGRGPAHGGAPVGWSIPLIGD